MLGTNGGVCSFTYMTRTKILILFSLIACVASAQEKFTEYLTRQNAGEGKVFLIQDADITALVNGKFFSQVPTVAPDGSVDETIAAGATTPQNQPHIRINGFRVQVYAGSNNRQSKNEAQAMASRVRELFPDVPVYANFTSPRWICRVGNFRTYEEAFEMLRQMKETGQFNEAAIVRSKISVTY